MQKCQNSKLCKQLHKHYNYFYNYWNKVIISKSLLHYEHKDYPHCLEEHSEYKIEKNSKPPLLVLSDGDWQASSDTS